MLIIFYYKSIYDFPHFADDKENFVQIGSVDSTIRQEINLDFLEKFSKVLSFSRGRGWHFQLLLCDKRSIAGSSFCVWFNHVWVFRFVVYRSMWRFRFVCFGNRGFQSLKEYVLFLFLGSIQLFHCTWQSFKGSGFLGYTSKSWVNIK